MRSDSLKDSDRFLGHLTGADAHALSAIFFGEEVDFLGEESDFSGEEVDSSVMRVRPATHLSKN